MNWDRRVVVVLALVAGALVFAGGVKYARLRAIPPPVVAPPPVVEEAEPRQAVAIKVHIAGAVSRSGVYELPATARVIEAVEKAGPLPEADLDALNLAAPLTDGQKILVPLRGENAGLQAAPASGPVAPGEATGGLVDINSAGLAEFESLPGIGPALAQRILAYREEHGPFRAVEDIMNVSGIGEGRFEQIKDLITVN